MLLTRIGPYHHHRQRDSQSVPCEMLPAAADLDAALAAAAVWCCVVLCGGGGGGSGGYAVLKQLQAALGLPSKSVIPSFAALRDYGNTRCGMAQATGAAGAAGACMHVVDVGARMLGLRAHGLHGP